jgi:hypothetical protein
MNTETLIIGVVVFTATFVVWQKRRNVRLPLHQCSQLWCIIWGLIGIAGLVSGLIQHYGAVAQRAALEPDDPDVVVSAVVLLAHISIALLAIRIIGMIVSTIYFFIRRKQRRDYAA